MLVFIFCTLIRCNLSTFLLHAKMHQKDCSAQSPLLISSNKPQKTRVTYVAASTSPQVGPATHVTLKNPLTSHRSFGSHGTSTHHPSLPSATSCRRWKFHKQYRWPRSIARLGQQLQLTAHRWTKTLAPALFTRNDRAPPQRCSLLLHSVCCTK